MIIAVIFLIAGKGECFELVLQNNTEYWYAYNLHKVDPNGIKKDEMMQGGTIKPNENLKKIIDAELYDAVLFRLSWIFLFNNENTAIFRAKNIKVKEITAGFEVNFISVNKNDIFLSDPSFTTDHVLRKLNKS